MDDFWHQLETDLSKLAPDLLKKLRPGADEEALAQAEQRLQMPLPEDLKVFFRGHNGSDGPCFGSWEFLSVEKMCEVWLLLKSYHPSVRFVGPDDPLRQWNLSWLPLLRAVPTCPFYFFLKLEWSDEQMHTGCLFQHDGLYRESFLEEGTVPSFQEFQERFLTVVRRTAAERFATSHLPLGAPYPNDAIWQLVQFQEKYHMIARYFSLFPSPRDETVTAYPRRVAYPGLMCLSYTRKYAGRVSAVLERSLKESWDLFQATMEDLSAGRSQLRQQWQEPFEQRCMQFKERAQLSFPKELKTWYEWCMERPRGGVYVDWWQWCSFEELDTYWNHRPEGRFNGAQSIPFAFPETYLASADPRIHPLSWHPHWIPFMLHIDGSLLCIDLAPTVHGQEGQVIAILLSGVPYRAHRLEVSQVPPVVWVAPSFRVFLSMLAQDLVEGCYTYDNKGYTLWSPEGRDYVQGDDDLRRSGVAAPA